MPGTKLLYGQLKPRHIRLLDVHVGDGTLQGSLRVVHLDDCQAFLALSYVWAQDVPIVASKLECDGQMLYPTANCLSALWHLRQKLGLYTIWVDSICINQNDAGEKGQQLPLMGDIFVRAATTYVWLGPSSSSSDRVLQFLSTSLQRYISSGETASYSPNAAALHLALAWSGISRNPFPYGRSARKLRRPWFEKTYAYNDELVQLLDQPYLHRIWTYQEILLATSPRLLCGTEDIDWHRFTLAMQLQSMNGDLELEWITSVWDELLSDRAKLQPLALGDDARHLAAVLSRYKLLRSWIISITMLVLMMLVIILFISSTSQRAILVLSLVLLLYLSIWAIVMLRNSATNKAERSYIYRHKDSLAISVHARSALEPKDKAFGVSAILTRRGAALQASYEDSTESVFRSLAESVLRCTRSFDMLYLAAIESQAGGPSWVPRWDVQGSWPSRIDTTIAGLPKYISQWHEHLHVSELLAYEAEAAPFAIRGNSLHVEAYQLGVCTAVARFREVDLSLVHRSLHIANFRAAKACVQWAGVKFLDALSVSPTPAHLREWLRLLQRRDLEQSLRNWEDGLEPQSIIDMLPVHMEICNILARHDAMLCVARFRLPDIARLKRRTAWYEQYLLRAMFNDCARVAVCSPKAQVGDTIIRVKGMHIPVMLRRQRLVSPFKMIRHAWHTYVLSPGIPLSPAQDVLRANHFQLLEIV